MKLLFKNIFVITLLFHGHIYAQETCSSAIPISLGNMISGSNVGALIDFDYSSQTGCNPSDYNSAVWYSFDVPFGTGSLNFTYTGTGIGPSVTVSIVDDCTSENSNTFIWYECSANTISGAETTICSLEPGSTYYIQVASDTPDEGTFNLEIETNPDAVPNDLCINATPMFGDGLAECGEFDFVTPNTANACPDVEASNICIMDTDPGVWYTFTVPDLMNYNYIGLNPVGSNFDIFMTFTGCDDLTYVDCQGYIFLVPEPGATYYILSEDNINANVSGGSVFDDTCEGDLIQNLNTGAGTGGAVWGNLECSEGNDIVPCMNDVTDWFEYTTGCEIADITISLDPWQTAVNGQMNEGGLAVLSDCDNLMSEYDPNGLGYVCSALVNDDELILDDVPPGTVFIIAVGTILNNTGYYELTVVESAQSGVEINDNCIDASTIIDGINEDLSNHCSTADFDVENCPSNGEATVWYEYSCPPGNNDLVIELLPGDIGETSIAAYEDCNGSIMASICGTILNLDCVSGTILFQVGSSTSSIGNFDLDITSTPSAELEGVDMNPQLICSGESTDLLITIIGGVVGDITVTVAPSGDPSVLGEQMHLYTNVNSATLDDVLTNTSNMTADAVYFVYVSAPGYTCPSGPYEVVIPVNPQFTVTNQSISECLPTSIDYFPDVLIEGGTSPYTSYVWLWDGTDVISSTSNLENYMLTADGEIILEIEDANGCVEQAIIEVEVFPEVESILTVDVAEACQGDPPSLTFEVNINVGLFIENTTWEVFDENMNPIFVGLPSGLNYYFIETSFLSAGTYSVQAYVTDENGCLGSSNIVDFTIEDSPFGDIEILQENCMTQLQYQFYGPNGTDIYGHGPDSNADGIPDIFDLDDDGVADFVSITWTDPSSGITTTDDLIFTPTENGVYTIEIITETGCTYVQSSAEVILSYIEPIVIEGPIESCLGELVMLSLDAGSATTITWSSNMGVIGTDIEDITVIPTAPSQSFFVETTDGQSCFQYDTLTILVLDTPSAEIAGALSICPGESTLIEVADNTSILSYAWLDSENTVISTDSFVTVVDSGLYQVIVENEYSCSDSLIFEIELKDDISFSIVGNDICDNEPSFLDAGPGYESYIWSDILGNDFGVSQEIEVNAEGVYIVEVMIGECSGVDSIEIFEHISPMAEVVDSLIICNNMNGSPDTLIDLNSMVLSSNGGNWSTVGMGSIDITDISLVNFAAVPVGVYTLIYTSNTAEAPCADVADTLIVTVSNCDCPELETMDMVSCNDVGLYGLNNLITTNIEEGSWTFFSGPDPLSIDNNNEVDFTSAPTGDYIFIYELTTVPFEYCRRTDTVVVSIIAAPVLVVVPNALVCNSTSEIAPFVLNLDAFVLEGDGSWIDPMIANLDFTDPSNLNFTGVVPGDYILSIMTNTASNPCVEIVAMVMVSVVDCNCPPLVLDTASSICNVDAIIDLDLYTGISEPGSWSAATDNPSSSSLDGTLVDLTNLEAGTYHFIYTLDDAVAGCPAEDSLAINLIEIPSVQIIEEVSICNANLGMMSTILNLNDLIIEGTGNWTDNDGNALSSTVIDFADETTGDIIQFSFTSSDAEFPCMNVSNQVLVSIIDCNCPLLDITESISICNSTGLINLLDYTGDSDEGSWTESNSNPVVDLLDGTELDFNTQLTGSYEFYYTLSNSIDNCPLSDTLVVSVVEEPSIISFRDTSICFSNDGLYSSLIDLTTLVNGDSGIWTDLDGNIVIDAEEVDLRDEELGSILTYIFTTTTATEPCEDVSALITITIVDCSCDDPVFANPPDLCNIAGEAINMNDLLLTDHQGTWEYVSGPSGVPLSFMDPIFDTDNIVPGIYEFKFTIAESTSEACQLEWLLTVTVVDQQTAELTPFFEVCTIEDQGGSTSVNLNEAIIGGVTDGNWLDSNMEFVEDPSFIDFINADLGNYIYSYKIENEPPCEDLIYNITISAIDCSDKSGDDIIMPNVFSPDDDGVNDILFPVSTLRDITISKMYIYDRWGNRVFILENSSTNTKDVGWNGKYNGLDVMPGVYVYFIEYTVDGGAIRILSGDVSVVR